MPAALLALAIGAFGIGTTEFVIMGLLPEVAGNFGVSIPVAGLLISGYALGVVVGAPLLTAITEGGGLRSELAAFRNPQVWLALATTALGFAGVFASFTYIAPMMTEVAGFSSGAVTWLLVLFGGGLVVGNILGGKAADRSLMLSLYVILALLAAVLLVFVFTAHAQLPAAITIALFGAAGFATVAPLQTRVMEKAKGAPALAASGLAVAVLSGLLDRRRTTAGPTPVLTHA